MPEAVGSCLSKKYSSFFSYKSFKFDYYKKILEIILFLINIQSVSVFIILHD